MTTVLAAELGVLTVALIVATVVMWRMWLDVLAKIIDRERAMDMHAKAVTREALMATAEARRSVATAQGMLEDAAAMHRRVEQHLSDPRVKRLLDG